MTILQLLAEHGKIKSFSEGRRLIKYIRVRRKKDSVLGEPELLTEPFDLSSGDVVLIGSHKTIVVP